MVLHQDGDREREPRGARRLLWQRQERQNGQSEHSKRKNSFGPLAHAKQRMHLCDVNAMVLFIHAKYFIVNDYHPYLGFHELQ